MGKIKPCKHCGNVKTPENTSRTMRDGKLQYHYICKSCDRKEKRRKKWSAKSDKDICVTRDRHRYLADLADEELAERAANRSRISKERKEKAWGF